MNGDLPQPPRMPHGNHLTPDGWLPVAAPIPIEEAISLHIHRDVRRENEATDPTEMEQLLRVRREEGMRNLRAGFKLRAADARSRQTDPLVKGRADIERWTLLEVVSGQEGDLDGTKLRPVNAMEDLVDLRTLYDTGDVVAARTHGFSAVPESRAPSGWTDRLRGGGTRVAAAVVLVAGLALGAFGVTRSGGEINPPSADPVAEAEAPAPTLPSTESPTSTTIFIPEVATEGAPVDTKTKPPKDKQPVGGAPTPVAAGGNPATPVENTTSTAPGRTVETDPEAPKQPDPPQPPPPQKTPTTRATPETSVPPDTAIDGR